MSRAARLILPACLTLAGVTGCAQRPPGTVMTQQVGPPTRPSGPAFLTLDEIVPAPVLPPPQTAGPATRPSLEALELFARARGELVDEHRLAAIPLLEQAAALDPDSYELHRTLAEAYRGALAYEDHSLAELEKAAALEPDHLDTQLNLGRQYLARGDAGKALEHLRLATQTRAYRAGGGRSPEADLFLAHALQQQGYDRAALQRYEQLLNRLGNRDLSRSADPDLAYQISDKLYAQVGDLYLKQGDAPAALAAYRTALRDAGHGHDALDTGLYARIVRVLLVTGRKDDAVSAAAEAVRSCRASADSVRLLREVCRAAGRPGGAEREMTRLHDQEPDDRPVLLALADVMRADGHRDAADRILARTAAEDPGDARVLRKRAELREADGDLRGAARLLIEATAVRPALSGQLEDVWARLFRPANPINRQRLTLRDLQDMPVAAGAEAARLHAVSRYAVRWPRRALARAALVRATEAGSIFPPAFRDRLERIWTDSSQTRESQARLAEQLCDAAEKGGSASLAAELRGRSLAARGDAAGAAAALAEAIRLAGSPPGNGAANATGTDPELQLAFASSYRAFDDGVAFERLLRKLIADHPTFNPAYEALHDYFVGRAETARADALVAEWRDAEPAALAPRLFQARDDLRHNQPAAAEAILTGLLEEYPDEPEVLSACRSLYAGTNRPEEFLNRLRTVVAREPKAFNAAEALARAEAAANRSAEAVRVLDTARAEAADEPDVLYDLSLEYARVGLPKTAEEVLEQVLKLDPANPDASNDLGYTWAEQGRNLDQAEALARGAVKEQPDNAAVLDSLGWVLYKRGRFGEARQALEQAVGESTLGALAGAGGTEGAPTGGGEPTDARTSPVVLDHLGDVMYRLNDAGTAGRLWERSQVLLGDSGSALGGTGTTGTPGGISDEGGVAKSPGPPRDDLGPLRLQLREKQRQLRAGRPVSVAPVAEAPAPPTAAPTLAPMTAPAAPPATRAVRAGHLGDGR